MSKEAGRARRPTLAGQLLTAEDVAARWQVATSQVYRLTREGQLAGVVVAIGRYYRYRLDALERWEAVGR